MADRKTSPQAPAWAFPAALILVAAAGLALWISLPDATCVFDGIQFSTVVDRSVDTWRQDVWNPRHLLFIRTFQVLRDTLAACGIDVEAYRLFQIVNSILGAAGLLLFGDLARRVSRSPQVGVLAALALGATACWGTRATEGQVYMAMTFGAVAAAWCAVRLIEAPSRARAAALFAAYALATLFHAADAFLLPLIGTAMLVAWPRRRAAALGAAAAALGLPLSAYAVFFGGVGLRNFFEKSTEVHVASGGYFSGLLRTFFGAGLAQLPGFAAQTGAALTPLPDGLATAAGAGLWLAAAGAFWTQRAKLDATASAQAAALAAGWAGFSVVNLFWYGGSFFYGPPLAFLFGLIALAAGPTWRALASPARLRLTGAVAAGALVLGWRGVDAGLLPQSRIENNPGYKIAVFVGQHTVPSSYVVISGLGLPNAKVYLPRFAQRTREVLEYYVLGHPKVEALARIRGFVERQTSLGVPLYLLSDLVEDGPARRDMRASWGIEPYEIQQAFGAGTLYGILRSPEVAVYLFIPQARRPELFTGLGYSILTLPAGSAPLRESIGAAKRLASEMSPPERRRAAQIMRERDWGFDLMFEAFSPAMDPESLKRTEGRRADFAALQKLPDFWLRAGNLDNILGLRDLAIADWTKAQKISGNLELLKKIEDYRRMPR
jgi:hypothetical protein